MAPGSSTHTDSRTPSGTRRRPRTPPRGKRDLVGVVGQASWISSVINLLNTIVGAGVLAMPLAMSHMGMVLGVVVIMWSAVTSGFGLYLQCRCAGYLERGSASFFALSQITYPNLAVIFDAAIAVKCFGVAVSYLIIIGDLMPGVVKGFTGDTEVVPYLVDRQFWITVFMLIVIPLSFLRRLDSLKYTSVVALISIGYLIILVVYHFAAGDTIDHYTSPLRIFKWAGPIQALSSLPVIVFAYTCHQNMFSILNEIADNSHFRTSAVVGASNGTAASIYVLVAITGYLSFGNDVAGNIVAQYAPSVSATIGRAAIVVLVMFSYPLQIHPCRASVDAVLKWRPFKKWKNGKTPVGLDGSPPRDVPLLPQGKTRNSDLGETRFAAITTVLIVTSYIVAMSVSSLEKVLAYVGSTGSTSISFILPGLFYYKISSPDSPLHQKLLKEEDDYDYDDEHDSNGNFRSHRNSISNESGENTGSGGGGGAENEGLLANSGVLSTISHGGVSFFRSKQWQRKMLRRLSLVLAIYGVVVMITCLVTNTFFIVNEP